MEALLTKLRPDRPMDLTVIYSNQPTKKVIRVLYACQARFERLIISTHLNTSVVGAFGSLYCRSESKNMDENRLCTICSDALLHSLAFS